MAKKLNSKEIEAARKTKSRSERRAQEKQRLHDAIKENKNSGGGRGK